MIKNIEDLKNIQIVCREIDQVEDCFNYLEQLGFKLSYDGREGFCFIIRYSDELSGFSNYGTMANDKYIQFYNKKFVKTLQKFIKEKEEKEKEKEKKEKIEDFEVAEDGRITKINNYKSEEKVFIACQKKYSEETIWDTINDFKPEFLDFLLKYGLAYTTAEARDRAVFKLEIETKLKNIAERLNAGRKIDWNDEKQNKIYILYDFEINSLVDWKCNYTKDIGQFYCLDNNFLNVAIKEIGEENLIKYFKE